MEQTYIAKMSVKALGCKPVKASGGKVAVPLCRIFGKATGIQAGEDKSGSVWNCLTGSFAGINLDAPGKEYRSGKLFLPGGIHETVESGVKAMGANEKGLAIQFALEIRAVPASNPIGYSYEAVNLVSAEATDELGDLRGKLGPAIEAPKTEENKEEKKEGAKAAKK